MEVLADKPNMSPKWDVAATSMNAGCINRSMGSRSKEVIVSLLSNQAGFRRGPRLYVGL